MSRRSGRSPPPKERKGLSSTSTRSHPSLFRWTRLPSERIVALEIIGEPDIGKTRFCARALAETNDKGKVTAHHSAVGDTEMKAWIEMEKIGNPYWKKLETMQDVRDFIDHCIRDEGVKVVCIDSGSDIREYAENEFLAETGQKRVWPLVLYGRVFSKIDTEVKRLHKAGKHFVCTSRMKDEFVDDERTGRKVRDSYKKFPYQLPMLIRLRYGIRDSKGKVWFPNHVFAKVLKNNWYKTFKEHPTDKLSKPWLFNVTFEGVLEELVNNPWDEKNIIWSAHEFLHANSITHNEKGTDQLKP